MASDNSNLLLHRIFLLSFLSCSLADSALAQDDGYYAGLRDQLDRDYGLTGGRWLIGGSETGTLSSVYAPDAVDKEIVAVERQPFTRAIRLTTTTRPQDPYATFVHFPADGVVKNSDVLLLVAWVRGVEGQRGRGFVSHAFELGQAPFTSVFSQEQLLHSDWQQWLVPFQVTRDMPSSWYKVHLGFQKQTVELGGVAVLNYGSGHAVADLPQSAFHRDYEGREPNAPWRAEARARIERHRKADLRIRVVDRTGKPIKGAEIALNQKRHAFGFGTSVYVPERAANQFKHTPEELAGYYEKLEDLTGDGRGFNLAVSDDELRWRTWEEPYWPPYKADVGQTNTLSFIKLLHAQDIRVRGHMLVWPEFERLPVDIEQHRNDPTYIRRRIADHIRSLVGNPQLKGLIAEWIVINEPVHMRDLENVFGGQAEYAEWFKAAAEADSRAKLFINEYGILSDGGMNLDIQDQYKQVIRNIEAGGGRVDGVGLQSHVGYPLTPPMVVFKIIDEFATLGGGKEISISEYDARGVEESIGGEYLRDFLTVSFSHPAVQSFLFWGYWDGNHWLDDAPLFRGDWTRKPSGGAYVDLVFREWWTNERGRTNARGDVAFRGFLGEYEITVSHGRTKATKEITLRKELGAVEISLR